MGGAITLKNVSVDTDIVLSTIVADKIEGEDTQILYPSESFVLEVYQTNKYVII